MEKVYTIYLDNYFIGKTKLENVDAPMGVVFGEIIPTNDDFNYAHIKSYCDRFYINGIGIASSFFELEFSNHSKKYWQS